MSEQMKSTCHKCGAEKQEGFPCLVCWEHGMKVDAGSTAVPTTGTDVVGHYEFHPAPGGYGWICPKCGRVYGPNTMECWGCNSPVPVTTGDTKWAGWKTR